jgi:antitoxin (DNA-binding transcriptional repressor) of toxin-antitoxin stability system
MKTMNFTDFRKNASSLLDDVEKGEIIRILRHGRPVAEISPVTGDTKETPSWKKPGLKLVTKGIVLSRAILEERNSV